MIFQTLAQEDMLQRRHAAARFGSEQPARAGAWASGLFLQSEETRRIES